MDKKEQKSKLRFIHLSLVQLQPHLFFTQLLLHLKWKKTMDYTWNELRHWNVNQMPFGEAELLRRSPSPSLSKLSLINVLCFQICCTFLQSNQTLGRDKRWIIITAAKACNPHTERRCETLCSYFLPSFKSECSFVTVTLLSSGFHWDPGQLKARFGLSERWYFTAN